MATSRNSKHKSLGSAEKKEDKVKKEKQISKRKLKIANHILSWLIGVFVALFPILACLTGSFLYKGNESQVSAYEMYFEDFVGSGSFMWVSVTLLAMSLAELLLHGYNRKFKNKKLFCNIISIISIIFLIWAIIVFVENIGNAISYLNMWRVSIAVFFLFGMISGVLSFYIAREE